MLRGSTLPVLAAKIAIILAWAALGLLVVRAYVPSPLPISFPTSRNILMVMPEGWGYFTRNPREPVMQFYRLDGKHEPVFEPNFSARYLFGLRRDGRKLGGEAGIVVRMVPAEAWMETRKRLSFEALPDSTVIIHSSIKNPKLCGDFLVQVEDRLPWAWANLRDKVVMPSKVAHVRIVCE